MQANLSGFRYGRVLAVFLAGFVFLCLLQELARPIAINGVYFQRWTSEDMMQTLPLVDVRHEPLRSLWYLHIQPPLLDILRAGLAQLWPGVDDHTLLERVDRGLYLIMTLGYACMGALAYTWLRRMLPEKFALLATLGLLLHPATIEYATFLDATFLTALGILWSYYELWRLQRGEDALVRLALVLVLLYLTRSLFQWPVLLSYVVVLLVWRVPWKRVLLFTALVGVVVVPYTLKQLFVFGLPFTSSFSGLNCFHGLGDMPTYEEYGLTSLPLPEISDASVLHRQTKLTGIPNYNHVRFLVYHTGLMPFCSRKILSQPWTRTLGAYLEDLIVYLQPSSQFTTPHVLADRLPWRGVYNAVFSGGALIGLFLIAAAGWLSTHERKDLLAGCVMLLPAACIFVLSVIYERGENMRYKFMLEPLFYIFLARQLYAGWCVLRQRFWRP